MSKSHKATRQQQRDRERRRAARREQAAQARNNERRRTIQAVVVGLVALAVIAGFVALSMALGSDPDDTTTSPAANGLACTSPPAVPGTPATFELPDAGAVAGTTFEAVVSTNCGDITVELDGTRSPQAVASFVSLAAEGFYDDSPCHRLLASGNIVLQCGDPTGTGTGGPGYGYGVEDVPEDGSYPRGTLAMARTADLENGTGSQFFVVAEDSVWPPSGGGYTIFGNVTGGMEIIDHIVAAGVTGGGTDGPPAQPISITAIAVTEK